VAVGATNVGRIRALYDDVGDQRPQDAPAGGARSTRVRFRWRRAASWPSSRWVHGGGAVRRRREARLHLRPGLPSGSASRWNRHEPEDPRRQRDAGRACPSTPTSRTRSLAPGRHYHLVEQSARDLFPLYGYREARTPVLERTELFVRGIARSPTSSARRCTPRRPRRVRPPCGRRNTPRWCARTSSTTSTSRSRNEVVVRRPHVSHERQQRAAGTAVHPDRDRGVREVPGRASTRSRSSCSTGWLRILGVPFEMHLTRSETRPAGRSIARPCRLPALAASGLCETPESGSRPIPSASSTARTRSARRSRRARQRWSSSFAACKVTSRGAGDAAEARLRSSSTEARPRLDYYTRTHLRGDRHLRLGAQSTLAGAAGTTGGEGPGRPDVPAIGFAQEGTAGAAARATGQGARDRPVVFIAPLGDAEAARADQLAQQLRAAGLAAEVSFRKSNPATS